MKEKSKEEIIAIEEFLKESWCIKDGYCKYLYFDKLLSTDEDCMVFELNDSIRGTWNICITNPKL